IADIAVKRLVFGWGCKGELPSGVEIEALFRGLVDRWPLIVTAPLAQARFVRQYFRQVQLALAFEMIAEKRELHFLAEIHSRLAREAYISEHATVPAAVPATVAERTHNQDAAIVRRRFFDLLVDGHGTVEIFRVEP